MFFKSILILFTATLFSTTAVLAMDEDGRRSNVYKKLQKRQEAKDMVYRPGWERVLDLYRDHVDYHIYMKNFITEESRNPSKEKLCAVLGMPLHATSIDKAIDDLRRFHQSQAEESQEFIDCRQQPGQILKKIALTYCYSITSQIDCEMIMEKNKQKIQQITGCQENEISDDYQIRAPQDEIQFHKRVQQKILEEFSPYLKTICENMIEFTGEALRDNLAEEEHTAFYKSVVDKTYIFPTNLKIEEITFEETPNSDGGNKKKRKTRKRRKKTTAIKNADTVFNLKEAKTSSLVEKNSEINLLQDESGIQTKKEPLLSAHTEESGDKKNLPPADTLARNWKHDLEVQIEKDRQKKIVSKKRLRTNEIKELQPILIKKAEIGKTEHRFFTEVCTTSVTAPNIEWKNLVNLFNNPNGFKGNVYGTSGGVTNTFEVFMKFKDGKFIEFLSENEFKSLKSKARPESRNERKFLKNNGRLESYRLLAGESIATSFFTLHHPHQPCLYMALLKRLRGQLDLLGLNPETVQSRE